MLRPTRKVPPLISCSCLDPRRQPHGCSSRLATQRFPEPEGHASFRMGCCDFPMPLCTLVGMSEEDVLFILPLLRHTAGITPNSSLIVLGQRAVSMQRWNTRRGAHVAQRFIHLAARPSSWTLTGGYAGRAMISL